MSHYTVRRDDAELRVVICPKCKQSDVTKFQDVIPYKHDTYFLRLMQCNKCHTYFTFYREDGVKEIDESSAIKGVENGRIDMRPNGEDCHGHSFYVIFKSKPPTITHEEYDKLEGFLKDKDGNYCDRKENFGRWKECIPSINRLVRYREIINNIDFDGMSYLEKEENEWFEEKPHPMLCFSHGGSEACENINKQYGFICPKCKAAKENACYECPSPNQEGKEG